MQSAGMAQDPDSHPFAEERRESIEAFYARGERAWQDYVRTGTAALAEDVFARLDALVAAHRARLLLKHPGDPD